jgi:hypothetical protein
MDPLGNLRRQTFDQASHGLSRSAHVTIIHGLRLKSKGENEEKGGQPKQQIEDEAAKQVRILLSHRNEERSSKETRAQTRGSGSPSDPIAN